MKPDLAGEYWTAWKAREDRQSAWVRRRLGFAACWCGVARVRIAGGGFELCPEGRAVLVAPVVDDPGLFWPPTDDRFIDLVAWDPRDPAVWWTRAGRADWLGEWAVDFANFMDAGKPDLRLCASPWSWLSALGAGANPWSLACRLAPLADGLTWRELLWGTRRVVCDDEDHAAALHKALRKRPPAPPIPDVFMAEAAVDGEAA